MPLHRIVLYLAVMTLIGGGVITIYNATDITAGELSKYKDSHYFVKQQLLYLVIGILAFLTVAKINYNNIVRFGWGFLGISIILLALVYTPLGVEINGARRWLDIRVTRIQPAEIASFSTIIFLVYKLTAKQRKLNKFLSAYVPMICGISVILGLIVFQPNLSVTILIGLTSLLLLFIGGAKPIHILYTVIAALPVVAILFLKSDYLLERLEVWKDPFKFAGEKGLQPVESMTALGVGGSFGVGLGNSRQKLFFLPYCHNDFIGAIIGEEFGFAGMFIVVLIYILIVVCGIFIAFKIKDLSGYLLATGITIQIALQTLIHLGVVTAAIPPTGINLPFVSYGGSNLVMNCIGLGLLTSVSRRIELQPKEKYAIQSARA